MNTIVNCRLAICYSFVYQYSGGYQQELSNDTWLFVERQIKVMPDYMRFGIILLTSFFYVWVYLLYMSSFSDLHISKRLIIINKWKNSRLGVFRNLMRFYETLVLFNVVCDKRENKL